MGPNDELPNDLFTLTVNLETDLNQSTEKDLSAIVSGQRDASGRWEHVEIQLANDEDEIIYERVYPDRPSYKDVRDDYGPPRIP